MYTCNTTQYACILERKYSTKKHDFPQHFKGCRGFKISYERSEKEYSWCLLYICFYLIDLFYSDRVNNKTACVPIPLFDKCRNHCQFCQRDAGNQNHHLKGVKGVDAFSWVTTKTGCSFLISMKGVKECTHILMWEKQTNRGLCA